ncbi:MAG: alpha/beta hydrolase [Actinomycetota bacterium]|nr:alpha/beta hydrolase [Actinomycetota bacterium]
MRAALTPGTVSYGESPEQVADLWLPRRDGTSQVVVLIHGGCWWECYRRDLENDVAADLARRGYAVWNIEYRRLGAEGGWPECHQDVVLAISALQKLDAEIDPQPIALVGHSAGGYLALLAASEVQTRGVVAQAPVADLRLAAQLRSCTGGVEAMLLQGAPSPVDDPPALPHLVVQGDADEDVPVEIGREYSRAASAAEYVELAGCGHYEHLDPASSAWHVAIQWIEGLL